MTHDELRLARMRMGYSLAELAQALETPYRTLQDWQAGRRPIPGVAAVAVRLLLERREHELAPVLERLHGGPTPYTHDSRIVRLPPLARRAHRPS